MCYLITCDSSHSSGLYRIALPTLAHELGCPLEGASKALRRVSELGFCVFDQDAGVVFVTHMAREQIGPTLNPGDKRRKGLVTHLEDMSDTALLADWLREYSAPYGIDIQAPSKPLPSPFQAPSKGVAHRDRNRDRNRDRDNCDESLSGKPEGVSPGQADRKKTNKTKSRVSSADHGLATELVSVINRALKKKPPHLFRVGKQAIAKSKALRAMMHRDGIMFDVGSGQIDTGRLHAVLEYRIDKARGGDYCTPVTLLNLALLTEWPERYDNRPSSSEQGRRDDDGPRLPGYKLLDPETMT
jgi:hypothetical protein